MKYRGASGTRVDPVLRRDDPLGDDSLDRVCDRLRTVLRPQDKLIRTTGTQFTMLCPEMPDSTAAGGAAQKAMEDTISTAGSHGMRDCQSVEPLVKLPFFTAFQLHGAQAGSSASSWSHI